jgi:hypothetical protein
MRYLVGGIPDLWIPGLTQAEAEHEIEMAGSLLELPKITP